MANDQKHSFWDWIGWNSAPEFAEYPKWLGGLLGCVIVGLALLLSIAALALFALLLYSVLSFSLPSENPAENIRNLGLAAVTVVGLPFLVWRSIVAQKQADVAEQGLITDRINKAVEGLGAEKIVKRVIETPRYRKKDDEWLRDEKGNPKPALRPDGQPIVDRQEIETTEPNLEVRIGALYALERISHDSARDHIQIMEILCAYIVNNAGRNSPILPTEPLSPDDWLKWGAKHRRKLPPDIDVALRVIARRSKDHKEPKQDESFHLDLKHASFAALDLSDHDFTGMNLNFADFCCADLTNTKFIAASLIGANLQSARFDNADFQNARFESGRLEPLSFHGAIFSGAMLHHVTLESTPLWANCVFSGTAFRDIIFPEMGFEKFSTSEVFADATVTLPNDVTSDHDNWPPHWPRNRLNERDFEDQWRKWQADPDNYEPPHMATQTTAAT